MCEKVSKIYVILISPAHAIRFMSFMNGFVIKFF